MSNKYKKIQITIQDRITLYKQALTILNNEYDEGRFYGWCYALTYTRIFNKLGIPDVYIPTIFRANFQDLLKYAKKKHIGGYLFPCDEKGYRHRVAVLKYRITELKEQLNK